MIPKFKNHKGQMNYIKLLGESKDPSKINELIELIKSEDYTNKRLASSALSKLSEFKPEILKAIPALIKLLNDDKAQVRQYAIKALGVIGSKESINSLQLCLSDKKEYNRESAKLALKQIMKQEPAKDRLMTKIKKIFSKTDTTKEKSQIKEEHFEYSGNREQGLAVHSLDPKVLVLAGAGSGKTKVLTDHFVHLVKDRGIPGGEIMAITFTKDAASEMRERISKKLGIPQEKLLRNVRTFHSLCLSIMKQNEQFELIMDDTQEKIVYEIIKELIQDEDFSDAVYGYLVENLVEYTMKTSDKNKRYPRSKDKPDPLGTNLIKTTSGIMVRSKSEKVIADFLTSLGLTWEYEKQAEWVNGKMCPDFLVGNEVYIELWCYNKDTPEGRDINKKKYLKHRSWKEEEFKIHKKKLISIELDELKDLKQLKDKLKIELKELLKASEIRDNLLEVINLSEDYKKSYDYLVRELLEVINLSKSMLVSSEELKRRLEKNKEEKVIRFYEILLPVLKKYEEYLATSGYGKKDFNDLISQAVKLLRSNKERRNYYQKRTKYLLVDEFQDVSYGQVELLKLLHNEDGQLFVVGDDWQSIYGWRGSNVDYILNFKDHFGEPTKIILPINYRSIKNIVDASSYFIQLSKKQIKKDISCSEENSQDRSKITQVNAANDFASANYILSKINEIRDYNPEISNKEFMVLYRSSRTLGGYKNAIAELKTQGVLVKTIHGSKGMEADYVFVVGLKNGLYGFPNVYPDKEIKKLVLNIPVENKEEEERRLFYVAMTRAKKRLFLMSEEGNESDFVEEIPLEYKEISRPFS